MNRLRTLLRSKVFGIPVPFLVVGAAAAAWWWYMGGGLGVSGADEEAADAMDPTEGADAGATGLVEPPATVVYQSYNLPPGCTQGGRKPCPGGTHWNGRRCVRCRPGMVWSAKRRRCVRRRRQTPAPVARRYATGGGRGAGRTSSAGRVISARR